MKRYSLKQQLIRERKKKDKIFFILLFLIFVFFSYSFFFGNMGYLKYRELKINEQKILQEINEISAENRVLRYEIELLKNDRSYLEKYAKEKFGLVKPGEMIFQFHKEKE